MPDIQSAKQIAEKALSMIGAFPASRAAPDPGELRRTLQWLEMLLNYQTGARPIGGFWQIFDIPLEAGIGDYPLDDYCSDAGVSHVFSAFVVTGVQDPIPLDQIFESQAAGENLTATGTPSRFVVTTDGNGVMRMFPTPTQADEDAGRVVRVRVQTFHEKIDAKGTGDIDIRLRPSWYLWAVKRLSYEIGSGAVRRLADNELQRLQRDAKELEDLLLARGGNGAQPPVQEPVAGSVDGVYNINLDITGIA